MVAKNNTKIIGNRTSASINSLFDFPPTEADVKAPCFFVANKPVEFASS